MQDPNIRTESNTYYFLRDIFGEIENKFIFVFAECLSNNTLINTPSGHKLISDIPFGIPFKVLSCNISNGALRFNTAVRINSSKKIVYEVKLENNRDIKASAEHVFFFKNDNKIIERKLKFLKTGDKLITFDLFGTSEISIKSIKKIGYEKTSDLIVERDNNFFANDILVHNSGYGKSLFCEAIMEQYKKAGYTVIILADVKGEIESGFAMFKTKKRYHLEFLRKIGKPIETVNVKLYHPFTFNIPKNTSLPEFTFYGISLKDLKREEWAMLAESMSDSDTIRLLLNTCQNLSRTDGLYTFLHTIEESVLGRKEKRTFKPDPKNFFLRSTPATGKSLQDVSSYLMPFKYDYFLVADTSPIKLNWVNILNDNSSYHSFCSLWIKDEKIRQFCILNVLNSIVDNLKYAKRPILIVIPEIRKLTPFKPEGYAKFLAESIKSKLTILRNMGKGVSGLFDSQIWGDVDEDVRNSSTLTFYGKMGGAGDIEKIAKARNYKREIRDQLSNMEVRGSYFLQGKEDLGAFIGWMPGHSHKEPEFNFFEEYKDNFPERMKEYNPLIELMKNNLKEEEDKIKEKIKNRIKEEKEAEEAVREKRSEKSNQTVEKLKEEKKSLIDQSKLEKMRLLYEDKIKAPELSFRVLGKKYGVSNHTAIDWYDKTKIRMEGEKKVEETKDYETKVLEDLNKTDTNISTGDSDKDNVQDL